MRTLRPNSNAAGPLQVKRAILFLKYKLELYLKVMNYLQHIIIPTYLHEQNNLNSQRRTKPYSGAFI